MARDSISSPPYPSLNIPNLTEETTPSQQQDESSVFNLTPKTDSIRTTSNLSVNFVLTQLTRTEINKDFTVTSNSNKCTKIYLYHPLLPITMRHIHAFHGKMHLDKSYRLSNRFVLHHLRITAVPPLIPQDKSLHITMNNIIYPLILPPCVDTVVTPRGLHLFFNPHNRMPYLQPTYNVDGQSIYRHLIITNLSSTCVNCCFALRHILWIP